MLTIMLIWLYSAGLFIFYGNLFLSIFFPNQTNHNGLQKFFLSFFAGFAIVNFLASFLSLFMPTGWISNLVLIALLIIGYAAIRSPIQAINFTHKNNVSKLHKTIFIVLSICIFLTAAYISSGTAKNTDTYLYHAQSIHWIESHPAIKGLGNFFVRFAYNSSWFLQTALFSFSFFGGTSFHVMSGLLFTIFSHWVLASIFLKPDSVFAESIAGLLLIPLVIFTMGSEMSSPSNDLPVSLLIWTIVLFTFQHLRRKERSLALELTILLLSIFAVTIKLSALPILLIPGVLVLERMQKKQWKMVLLLVLVSVACFTPWVLRSVIQSGYLVYPVEFTGLSVTWKIPATILQEDVKHIRVWGFENVLDTNLVMSRSYIEKMTVWFRERTRNQKILFLGGILTPFISIPMIFFTEKKKFIFLLPMFAGCVGLLYWMLISPNIRFGYAWLLMMIAIFFGFGSSMFLNLFQQQPKVAATIKNVLLLGICLALFLTMGLSMKDILNNKAEPLSARILMQMDYLPRGAEPCYIYQTEYQVLCAKEYNECGYHNFPCFPWKPTIGMFDKTELQQGFYPITEQ